MFFEDRVEGGFGIETGIKCQRQNCELAVSRICEFFFHSLDAVRVHEIEEFLIESGVDDFREIVG